jgi:hypothetical protein
MHAKAVRTIACAATLLAALACSTLRTSSDYDPTADFTSLHTYGWLPDNREPTGHPRIDNPMLHERIRSGIDRALKAKGFAPSEDPDFVVTYHLSAEQKTDVTTYNNAYYGGYGYVIGFPETTVRQYEEGTLIIDIIDRRAKKVVWRGSGTRRLREQYGQQDPAELEQRVFEAVTETLADFPPQRK